MAPRFGHPAIPRPELNIELNAKRLEKCRSTHWAPPLRLYGRTQGQPVAAQVQRDEALGPAVRPPGGHDEQVPDGLELVSRSTELPERPTTSPECLRFAWGGEG